MVWRMILGFFLAGIASTAVGQPCDPAAPSTAIYDLGTGTYKTFEGGLYPGGINVRPAGHEAAGVALAESIEPLDVDGNPDTAGRIVLISIGYSNMTQEWAAGAVGDPGSIPFTFKAKAEALQQAGAVNPKVLIVDGAKGGQATNAWAAPINPSQDPWFTALTRLTNAGSSRFQVQIACVKVAHAGPNQCMAADGSATGDAGLIAFNSAATARNLKSAFPNIKLAYFLTRTYGGYALTQLNPEPFAYETGFGVKWMIEAQIAATGEYGNLNFDPQNGPVVAPWLAWGPYIWANGTNPNGLGIFFDLDDFRPDDRTHPARGAVDKVSGALANFFLTDSTTAPWFAASQPPAPIPAISAMGVIGLAAALLIVGGVLIRRSANFTAQREP